VISDVETGVETLIKVGESAAESTIEGLETSRFRSCKMRARLRDSWKMSSSFAHSKSSKSHFPRRASIHLRIDLRKR
jgi:hypothetical protein